MSDDDFDGRIDCADSDCLGQPGCAPSTWTCDPELYLDMTCDCGCGAIDPAMRDGGSCNPQGGCPGNINPAKNAVCL